MEIYFWMAMIGITLAFLRVNSRLRKLEKDIDEN